MSLLLPPALVQEKGPYFPRTLEILRKLLQPIPEDLQFKEKKRHREGEEHNNEKSTGHQGRQLFQTPGRVAAMKSLSAEQIIKAVVTSSVEYFWRGCISDMKHVLAQ